MSRESVSVLCGSIGAFLGSLFGGFDMALRVALIFMVSDWIIGVLVTLVFKSSSKTEDGKLSSKVMFTGLIKKGFMLTMVLIGHNLDLLLGMEIIRMGVCYYIIAMELTSLMESWSISGLPHPKLFDKILEVLNEKSESNAQDI
ncbi:phage holin family protein [Clostridium paraputrificum]|uniref:phage holin family protein n=1 Tax=Clostridium paraputrificum TaxID=29363 RepID=UPI001B3C9BB9|nr:phage holin family protein [Clostridium paraputrificum]